jgi:hypothetical protein
MASIIIQAPAIDIDRRLPSWPELTVAFRWRKRLDSSMAVRQHGYPFPGGEIGHAASSQSARRSVWDLAAERRMEVNFFRVGNGRLFGGQRMRFAGIDIGSRTIELVVVDDAGKIKASRQADTGFDPITEAKSWWMGSDSTELWPPVTAATCSRSLLTRQTVTEIKAHAKGRPGVFPGSPEPFWILAGRTAKPSPYLKTAK